jgi:hypothetical protein
VPRPVSHLPYLMHTFINNLEILPQHSHFLRLQECLISRKWVLICLKLGKSQVYSVL